MKKVTLIKTNGEESVHEFNKLSIPALQKLAGCDCFDTVNLRDGKIMMVDDTGMLDDKPPNKKATELYHGVCRPGATNPIAGDVVICVDADWE